MDKTWINEQERAMTPVENKAKELYETMLYKTPMWTPKEQDKCAKACAIICCNEVLQSLMNNSTSTEPYLYWQQVKKAIEQL